MAKAKQEALAHRAERDRSQDHLGCALTRYWKSSGLRFRPFLSSAPFSGPSGWLLVTSDSPHHGGQMATAGPSMCAQVQSQRESQVQSQRESLCIFSGNSCCVPSSHSDRASSPSRVLGTSRGGQEWVAMGQPGLLHSYHSVHIAGTQRGRGGEELGQAPRPLPFLFHSLRQRLTFQNVDLIRSPRPLS